MKKLIIILLGFFAAVSAMGQAKTSASFGLDPSDHEAVERMRARSDSIRAHRPVTALVLSGGGAKGAATIGALKYTHAGLQVAAGDADAQGTGAHTLE